MSVKSQYIKMSSEDSGKVFMDYSHKDGPRIIESPLSITPTVVVFPLPSSRTNQDINSPSDWQETLNMNMINIKTTSNSNSPPLSLVHHYHHQSNKSASSSTSSSPSSSHHFVDRHIHGDNFSSSLDPYSSQPWFYGALSREDAELYLKKYTSVDGVFLVRESSTNPSCFVLSFIFNWKVNHVQIQQLEDTSTPCLSLDCGKTKFYDLIQLVEFYQLNYGVLPTKLTHFLVHPKHRQLTNPTTTTSTPTTSSSHQQHHH